jgi:hypothetical protein
MNKLILGLAITALTFTACKKKEIEPVVTPTTTSSEKGVLIGTQTTSANETVVLYADRSDLQSGYNNFYIKLTDASGAIITTASIDLVPMMDMTTMTHSCPVEQPVYNTASKKYEGSVVFTMSSMGGTWTVEMTVNGNQVIFPITVAEPATKIVGSYSGTDGEKYIISLIQPITWKVGLNDIEIMINRKETMMSFPADNDFEVIMTPEMPSMGHGSPNNVSPTLIGNGRYKGVVNYTMTGDWRLHFELKKAGTTIHSDAYLDILF